MADGGGMSILKNKWVVGGGLAFVALAVVYNLINGSGSSGQSATVDSGTLAANAALSTAEVQGNDQVQIAGINAGVTNLQTVASVINNLNTAQAQLQSTIVTSYAGVTQNMQTNQASVIIDALNNSAKTQQTWLTTQSQDTIAGDQLQAAQAQAKAASSSSMWGALGSVGGAAALGVLL